MLYAVVSVLLMFILSVVCFVYYNKGELDDESLVAALVISLCASAFWFVAIPMGIVVGGAWWIAKSISKEKK